MRACGRYGTEVGLKSAPEALDKGFLTVLHVRTDPSGNRMASSKSSLAPLSTLDGP